MILKATNAHGSNRLEIEENEVFYFKLTRTRDNLRYKDQVDGCWELSYHEDEYLGDVTLYQVKVHGENDVLYMTPFREEAQKKADEIMKFSGKYADCYEVSVEMPLRKGENHVR